MAETASRLPEEDRPQIRPEELRDREHRAGGGTGTGTSSQIPGSGGSSNTGSGGSANLGKTDSSSRLGGGTSTTGGGLYSPSELDDAESEGGLYNGGKGKGRTGSSRARVKFRKRVAIGGGILGLGIFGTVLLSSIAQGPAQLVDLDEILQKPSFGQNQDSQLTMNRLWRFYKTGNVGETRVSNRASKQFAKTTQSLSDIGIEFQRDSLDHIKSSTIDTEKLKQRYPELEGMTDAQKRTFLADKFGVSESQLIKSGKIYKINASDFGIKASRALTKNSLAALEDGKILTAIKFRVMAKYYNLPSIFHPIKRANAAAEKKLTTASDRKKAAQEEADRQKKLAEPAAEKAAPAEKSLKDKITGKNLATGALVVTAGMCLIRDISDDVVAVNFGSVVVPSSIQAVDKQAVGEQVKSGQDLNASQPGAVADSFVDENGKTIWNGKALQALSGMSQSGPDIPNDYRQAFAGGTTAQGIKDYVGGGEAGAIACSTPGKIIQGVASIALVVSGFFDGGISWAAKAAQEGASAAATAGAMALIQSQATALLATKAIVPQVLSGPVGGNLLAFGARASANMGARASGGVALSALASASIEKQQQVADQQSFRSQSFFARMFNTKDYRSLTGRLAMSINPSLSQNMASLTTSFMNFGNWIPHMFSVFIPKTQAADPPYDWGFSLYGIPPQVMNDPQLQDPYDNAAKIADEFDNGDPKGYKDKAMTCFGVDINNDSGLWDATPQELVNPNSDDYANAHCDDISDEGWRRVILFVFDTETMNAVACYEGDTDACSDLGIDGSDNGGGTTAPTTEASATIDMDHLYDSSVDVACAPNTKDLGIQDGYVDGKVVKIRICAVSNLPSTGEESNGGYGVSGADGMAVVNSRVSGAVYAMVQAAKDAGIPMSASSTFRTMSHQESLCAGDSYCAAGDHTYVAAPGTSNHQLGAAIDFVMADPVKFPNEHTACVDVGGRCEAPGDKVWEWLDKNTGKFNYKFYVNEFWHWSPDGR